MIYKMDEKEIKHLLRDFYATRYGKIIFLICYTLPFITFLLTIGIFIFSLVNSNCGLLLVILSLFCMSTFCMGSYFYYRELRIFADTKK